VTDTSGNRLIGSSFGVRLRAARKMAGMSMEDLATKLGGMVTKQAIGKYEKGRMMPTPAVLERLIEVLDKATWGASPLKPSDLEAAERMLLRAPDVEFGSEDAGRGRFLRQRALGKLMRKPASSFSFESAIFLHRADQTAKVQAAPNIAHSLIKSDFPPLAERRARYVQAWEAVSGPDKIRFREGEKLSAKSATALKYRLADHFERYLRLESLLGMTAPFENPLGGSPVRTPEKVEAAASEVRRRWDLGSGPVVNLLGCLDDRGIRVFETSGIEGFEGLSGLFGAAPFIAVSPDFPADRVRFTAAHELGHVLCGFPDKDGAEGLCHAFAGAFLLPKEAVEKAFGPLRGKVVLGALAEIKTAYGISIQAAMYRAHALGLVTDRQLRSFRETVKARGWAVTEPVEYAGLERATRFRRLVRQAVASGILDVERAADMAGVSAEELKNEIGEIF
jgi:Zn-dependent peptidase ImmA (M78 family)/transcriptional regulator with XRE-family HTH domain